MRPMIPVFRPAVGREEARAVAAVLNSRWIGLGPVTRTFEERFARYIGVKYAVALNSGTAALHLALKTAGVEGGEVVTTPMTFVSTNHAILYNGATPVFCDIEPDTLNIDAGKIARLLTRKTKAIVVVHYGGHAADMGSIRSLARGRGIRVIEDVAHGCGGEYRRRKLGSLGDFGCFSFHAVKNMTTGDGGMITTNDRAAYERLLKLRWVGISQDTWARELEDRRRQPWRYDVVELGYKYHMTDLSAAIGLVQLSKLDRMNRRREKLCALYDRALSDAPGVERPVRRAYATRPSYHNYVIKCEDRDGLNEHLNRRGISTSVHFLPNNHYDMYRRFRAATPVAAKVWKRLLTLPLYLELTARDVSVISGHVKDYVSRA